MARITLRVLDGANRGTIYEGIPTPLTIGREEGNVIQLNDDRVSRFHLKVQEDDGHLVLTDLDSTNGTRVNGEHTQLRILRPGDLIIVGRSILLVGTRQEIRERLLAIDNARPSLGDHYDRLLAQFEDPDRPVQVDWDRCEDLEQIEGWNAPPQLPQKLSPGQSAQLAELLEYLLARIRRVVSTQDGGGKNSVDVSIASWQNLIDIQARLASYLRRIGEPDEPP